MVGVPFTRARKCCARVAEAPLGRQHMPTQELGDDVVASSFEGGVGFGDGASPQEGAGAGDGDVVDGFGVAGAVVGEAVGLKSRLQVAVMEGDVSQKQPRVGACFAELAGPLGELFCLGLLTDGGEGVAEADENVDVVGVEADGLAPQDNGTFELAEARLGQRGLVQLGGPPRPLGVGVAGLHDDDALFVAAPCVVREPTWRMASVGIGVDDR